MGFVSFLEVREDLKNPNAWELLSPLIYRGKWETFQVPQGFVTDFASTPRLIWWLIPPYGRYTRAAVLHDWFYRIRADMMPRKEADGIFRRVMREEGVGWRRWVMWAAVRLFGGFAWVSH